jgi:hypothetical protein
MRKFRLQCVVCGETFVHVGDEFPEKCPLPTCGAYVGLNGKPEVTLPFLSKSANKSPDVLNRVMEEGANHRINMAAEATGLPASDFNSMKHTDMKDGLHEGDTSFKPTPVPEDMTAQFGNGTGGRIDPNILEGVRSGGNANMGSKQMPLINQLHQRHSNAIVRRSTQGRY